MTDLIRSLDPQYYIDPVIFRAENEGLLRRTWQFAGHVSQLTRPGDYFTFSIAGENLFCVMDNAEEVRAYYNVCQHRAHELVEGFGNSKSIVCPYHAWSYALTGELRNAPNAKNVPGFDKGSICLTPVRIEEFCGFLFANLDPDADPMDVWFPNVREELSAFVPNYAELKPVEWVEIAEQCNWKVSIENYSECYHCSLNHPTFSKGVVKPDTYDIQPQGYCLRHTTECQNLDEMTYPIDLSANPHAGEYSSWFLWPMFSFQVYPGNVLNTYHWRATDTDHVTVWRGWYGSDDASTAVARQLSVQDRETTVAEDIRLVESVFRGLKSSGYRPGPLVISSKGGVNSEHSIKALQQWMRDAVPQPAPNG